MVAEHACAIADIAEMLQTQCRALVQSAWEYGEHFSASSMHVYAWAGHPAWAPLDNPAAAMHP